MDYEKKYNEAIERAKMAVLKCRPLSAEINLAVASAVQSIFPQLCESEDESIRRTLVEYFGPEAQLDLVRGVPIQKIRDWLEKQKEPTPADGWDYADNRMSHPLYLEGFEAGRTVERELSKFEKQKEQNREDEEFTDFTIYHPLKNGKGKYECIPYSFYGSLTSFSEDKDLIDFLRTCFYTKEECNKWIEKQKEQKPAEDKYQQELEATDRWQEGYEAGYNAAPKPAKWSEEDKKMLNTIISEFEAMSNNCETVLEKNLCAEKVTWLKSLRPKVNANSEIVNVNWSEEDEEIFNNIIEKAKGGHWIEVNEIAWLINRFKSLRPVKQEWSKKDEDRLYQVMETLSADKTVALRETPHCKALHKAYDEMLAWLKSLRPQPYQTDEDKSISKEILEYFNEKKDYRSRWYVWVNNASRNPHWKPSEEQIKALKIARSFVVDDFGENPTLSEILKALQEQLEKLM